MCGPVGASKTVSDACADLGRDYSSTNGSPSAKIADTMITETCALRIPGT